ncbi:hypothetical protein BCR33DRAFT_715379 [Rhizoclosmatium globosum]|uniref:Glycoside hydrolase n=1 Tax=Rhizoclosmatium globosum TaxID=329046 RepID=A0A1Y2CJ79_9FUNG|nr:hypothetical protein BCR33DRAFT_715379 [Rhizoclosmatium globosum]|eukprot:ORY46996.1 hypothetical protein BCR33DRAFT_715379 [Rhizoclosmatium globosum]
MTTYWTLPLLLASLASAARTQSASSHLVPAYGVVIPSWQGFGTSLGPWACVAGGSSMETKYADLFFTTKTVTLKIGGVDIPLPGLGLNIVRYNVGGTGRQGDFPGVTEYFNGGVSSTATGLNWWDLVEGYWINGLSNSSSNWDWSRDVNQRSMLKAAVARKSSMSSFIHKHPCELSLGGNLTDHTLTLFPEYVSQVVKHAINDWKVNVTSVSILNEPSKGNWNYPNITEEGLNVVGKADKFNVHGYEMSNTARSKLSTAIGDLPFGYADNSGMNMATALLNDINHLNPKLAVQTTYPARAIATDIASKYYVFAQFTRFIRPGDQILNSGNLPKSVSWTYTATDGSIVFRAHKNSVYSVEI